MRRSWWWLLLLCVCLAIVSNTCRQIGAWATDGGSGTIHYCYGAPWAYMQSTVDIQPWSGKVVRVAPLHFAWWPAPWHRGRSHLYLGGLAANLAWWSLFTLCCMSLTSRRIAPKGTGRSQISLAQAIVGMTVLAMAMSLWQA